MVNLDKVFAQCTVGLFKIKTADTAFTAMNPNRCCAVLWAALVTGDVILRLLPIRIHHTSFFNTYVWLDTFCHPRPCLFHSPHHPQERLCVNQLHILEISFQKHFNLSGNVYYRLIIFPCTFVQARDRYFQLRKTNIPVMILFDRHIAFTVFEKKQVSNHRERVINSFSG